MSSEPQGLVTATAAQTAPMSAGLLPQRKCACGQHTVGGAPCRGCGEKRLQRRAANRAGVREIPPVVHDVVRSPGQPLDTTTRAAMEPRFNHDFSRVRVHTDAKAAESARGVGALAYTVGHDLVFTTGRYDPTSLEGRWLIAHELSHVVQQSAGGAQHADGEIVLHDDAGPEREADNLARKAVEPRATAAPRALKPSPRSLQRLTPYEFFAGIPVIGVLVQAIFEGDFSDDTLFEYVGTIDKRNAIEGMPSSDNKARAIVKKWKAGASELTLTPNRKKLLILEMLDGRVTDGDREAILDLLEDSSHRDLRGIFAPDGVKGRKLVEKLDAGAYKQRLEVFAAARIKGGLEALAKDAVELPPANIKKLDAQQSQRFIQDHFPLADQRMAAKVLQDIMAVRQDDLDFEDEQELRDEIFKRMRIAQLMKESQGLYGAAFAYPEDPKVAKCPDYHGGTLMDARVNLAARDYWRGPILETRSFIKNRHYYFELTEEGIKNGYKALTSLFTPQTSFCDKTLIHCDSLITLIDFRAFAESIGEKDFNLRVKTGQVRMWLTYDGFASLSQNPGYEARSAGAVAMQTMYPTSEDDLIIGDHVVFMNHLAFDGLNTKFGSPWRLENAILVDKDSSNKDLFEGHGSGVRENRGIRDELRKNYNGLAGPAVKAANEAQSADPAARTRGQQTLNDKYPNVFSSAGQWWVREPNPAERPFQQYPLLTIDSADDPQLPGLRDPVYPSRLNAVHRPVESRKEDLPTR